MFKNKLILAEVPARGGSKRIPKKNLKKIHNKSLIQIVAECIAKTKLIDEAVISSDDEDILNEAQKYGLSYYFKRPKIISGDYIGDIPVLQNALKNAEKYNNRIYDIIIMLQPTSPLRKPFDIDSLIRKIVNESLDSVWTVHKVDKKFHPDKQLKINPEGYLEYFTKKGETIITNQELTDSYMKNGIGYAITREFLLTQGKLLGQKSGFILHEGPIVNIDDLNDLKQASNILSV